jgi:hypothetical protein
MPVPVVVKLQKHELYMAACVGVRRRVASLDYDKSKTYGEDEWDIDIEGACAELVVAKHLHVYWDGSIYTFKFPDLGGDIQVRHTIRMNGRLIFRRRDDERERYVFVVGRFPNYHICGWIYGYEAKKDEFLANPNNKEEAWFVPQQELCGMEEFMMEVV